MSKEPSHCHGYSSRLRSSVVNERYRLVSPITAPIFRAMQRKAAQTSGGASSNTFGAGSGGGAWDRGCQQHDALTAWSLGIVMAASAFHPRPEGGPHERDRPRGQRSSAPAFRDYGAFYFQV